jgi:uncharacterized protein
MDFERFGIKGFTPETRVSDFVKYLEQGKIMTTKCSGCGKRAFPPKADCPQCGGDRVEWVNFEEAGQVVTFTTVYYGPAGFEKETPYTIAIAQFPGGLQMLGHISKAVVKDTIKVGMKVRAVPVVQDGRSWYQFEATEK